MGLGLTNAKLAVNTGSVKPPVQRIKPARPSIAEEAVFIPKPHKRVDFVLQAPGGAGSPSAPDGKLKSPGSSSAGAQSGQLKPLGPSLLAGTPGNGSNIAQGELGAHGVTAESPKIYARDKAAQVVMVVDNTPQKDYSVIETQQEGRQINHDTTVHFTQQYDSYGRPRVGMSREPYDFAFTKFMVKTSQLHFHENVQQAQANAENFNTSKANQNNLAGQNSTSSATSGMSQVEGMVSADPSNLVMGVNRPDVGSGESNSQNDGKGMFAVDPRELVMGATSQQTGTDTGGKSVLEVAQNMGIDVQNVMVSNAVKASQDPSAENRQASAPLCSQPQDIALLGSGSGNSTANDARPLSPEKAVEAYTSPISPPSTSVSVAA